ncbi:MAG: GNAT family protein [Agriterribacter sp.]
MTIDNTFNAGNEYMLEDDRALLRPLSEMDYENLLPFSLHEPDLWKYSLRPATGSEGLKNYIKDAIDAKSSGKEYPFIVYDKQLQQYAGSTRFCDIQPAQECLQIGFTWYGKQFQGTGLNKHCKYLLLEFTFEKLNMKRVEFRADNDNKRSIAAMKSIGCAVEGILRSNGKRVDGSRRDSIVLSILQEEWYSQIKQELKNKIYLR